MDACINMDESHKPFVKWKMNDKYYMTAFTDLATSKITESENRSDSVDSQKTASQKTRWSENW